MQQTERPVDLASDGISPSSVAEQSIPTIDFSQNVAPALYQKILPTVVPTKVKTVPDGNSGTVSRSSCNLVDSPMPAPSDSNLKSLARSLVDLVEYAIFPAPPAPVARELAATPTAPSPTLMAPVPIVLEADDASSVGDLTATTYEMQVDIDELKRQIEHNEQRLITPIGHRPFGGHVTQTDNYFSDYERQTNQNHHILDLNDAMEASKAKQLAEGWTGVHLKR
jgi:hypothetical protein